MVLYSVWQTRQLSQDVLRLTALQGTSIYASTLNAVRQIYTDEVVARAARSGVRASHEYHRTAREIPLPVTLINRLAEKLSSGAGSPKVRIFSQFPFSKRGQTAGPQDDFEREALDYLRQHPEEAFYRFENGETGAALRYAVADRMSQSCVDCHNAHPQSPKRDWKVGDVRGVVSVTHPLQHVATAVSPSVEARSWMIVLMAFAGLGAAAILFFRLRRLANALHASNRRLQTHLEAQDAWAHEVYVSRERLRIVVEQIPAVIWTTDTDLRFTTSEGGGLKGLNLKPNETTGQNLYEYFNTDDPAFAPIAAHRRALKGEAVAFDTVWMDRSFAAHVEPLKDRTGRIQGTIGAAIDITEHKQKESRLMRLAEDLTRSNRDLEVFAFSASHDLKEPLRTITAHLQLLARRCAERLAPDERASLGFAVEGAKRMSRLIDSLLKYSRAGTQQLAVETVDFKDLARETLENLRPLIQEAGATVEVGDMPVVWGDRSQLGQLLQNLISNGIKYRAEAPPRVELSAYQGTNEWIFRVRDNGIGIAEENQKKVFAVFQRLHSQTEYPGEGIGLAVAKRIVERHGGRIWIVSNVGGGSSFYFAIPKTTFLKSPPASQPLPCHSEAEPLEPPLGRTGSRG